MSDDFNNGHWLWVIYPGCESHKIRLNDYGAAIGEIGLAEDDPIICEGFRLLATQKCAQDRPNPRHGLFIFNAPHWVYAYRQEGDKFIRVY